MWFNANVRSRPSCVTWRELNIAPALLTSTALSLCPRAVVRDPATLTARKSETAHAAQFKSATPAGISRGLESGAGLHFVVPAGRRHAERDPKSNRMAG